MKIFMWYVLLHPEGFVMEWAGAVPKRRTMIEKAVTSCLGYKEYQDLGDDKVRWKVLKRRGWKIQKAQIVLPDTLMRLLNSRK